MQLGVHSGTWLRCGHWLIRSIIRITSAVTCSVYEDTGWLADGIACSRFVFARVGTNLLSAILSGAYQCGIRDFDVNLA